MLDFPTSKIKPLKAFLSGAAGNVSLEIPLEPFHLQLENYSEAVRTSIRLEFINLPTVEVEQLSGHAFDFPINPDEGYIDGSVYFLSLHHPVDVSQIEFGEIEKGKLPVMLASDWLLEFENSGYKNFSFTIKTFLEI